MRIIAGEWRGRQIAAPKGDSVRPTLDRVREAWMSMVHTSLPEARVADLFAGSGALGLEALSRGAAAVDFVENDPRTFRVLKENLESLGAGDRGTLHREDAIGFVARRMMGEGDVRGAGKGLLYDVAFADPPYRKNIAVELASLWLKTPFATIFGVEHESSETLPAGGDTRRYGDTSVTIFRT
ncbi:MAG TPA: RsmD family RNA methyltransferase [Gemmatimonadaceae bacterium]|nr:RsmD family RNA methyltransferase [Gemmatimonadaceae bacterium]